MHITELLSIYWVHIWKADFWNAVHIHCDFLTTSSPAEGKVRTIGSNCSWWRMRASCLITLASVSIARSVWQISQAVSMKLLHVMRRNLIRVHPRERASSSCLQSTQLCMPITRHAVLWGTRTIRTPLMHTYKWMRWTQRKTQRQLQFHNHLHLVHLQHRAWVAAPQQMGESDAYDYMELPGVPRGTPLRAMPDEACEEGGAPYEVWPTSGCYLSAIIRFCGMSTLETHPIVI